MFLFIKDIQLDQLQLQQPKLKEFLHHILKVADWSRETTFTRFYYRPLDNVGVGINLLSQNWQVMLYSAQVTSKRGR